MKHPTHLNRYSTEQSGTTGANGSNGGVRDRRVIHAGENVRRSDRIRPALKAKGERNKKGVPESRARLEKNKGAVSPPVANKRREGGGEEG